ncbi:hypothetical protein LUCX_74 [Xanthomonas phage vB_XciM_LucasX]|nr:hypothetical protein LUCX_74 [Xanthomonas phage vB_XciM_LucasX]
MKITKMLMLEVGTYDDMYQRPYTSHVDGVHMTQLQEATHYGQNLTASALSAVGSDIIRPSSTVSAMAGIVNGYDQRRLCFMMEVEFPGTTGGMCFVEYLTGYTDELGVSTLRGNNHMSINPNMRLFFNNVIQARRVAGANQFGRQYDTSVNGGFQLITSDYQPRLTSLHKTPHLMRPQDVFTSMSMERTRSIMGDHQVYDTRATHGPARVAVSARKNSLPGSFLSSMLTTWRSESDKADHSDDSTLYSSMAATVAEPTISRMRTLSQLEVASELRIGGSVSWRELCDADDTGTLEDRVQVTLALSDRSRGALSQRGEMCGWNGNGNSAVVATSFVQAVPGFMMQLMLTMLDFSVTNRTLDGSWQVLINGVQSFNDGDNSGQIDNFIFRLTTELMPGLSRGNEMVMTIHAQFDVMSQTYLQVDLDDGEGLVPYMAPSFCDGLFASTRAPDSDTLDNFAHNLSQVMYGLEQDFSAGGMGYGPDDAQFNNNQGTGGYGNSGLL